MRYPLRATTRSLAKCALIYPTVSSAMVFLPELDTTMVADPWTLRHPTTATDTCAMQRCWMLTGPPHYITLRKIICIVVLLPQCAFLSHKYFLMKSPTRGTLGHVTESLAWSPTLAALLHLCGAGK